MLLASVMRIIWMTDMTTRKKSTRTITKKALRKHWKIHRSLQQPRKTARAAMNKKIPMRQCVGCGEMKNKREMMRVLQDGGAGRLCWMRRKEERTRCLFVQKSGLPEKGEKEPRTGAFLPDEYSG